MMSLFSTNVSAQKFVHPGVAFTRYDLEQLKANITREPWLSAYNAFANDGHSKLTYSPQGPFVTVSRAPNLNNSQWQQDMIAIHHLAFMWWFTGDEAYGRKATDLLDAWAVTNTIWTGNESMLDIGDYTQYWGPAAEILRYTYPGWTQANTDHVKNYFANVLFPTSWVPGQLRDANKGALQLKIALAASIFCDDATRFNQSIDVYRMDAGGGMRNSLPNGEIGDSGRDDHWRVQAAALVWGAEVAYKQGIDMYAELDQRVLAIGELYNKYSFEGDTLKFIPLGGYSSFWTNWGIPTGYRQTDYTNILHGAYNIRKGIPAPYNDRMRALAGGAGGDFLYLKSADTTTAKPLTQVYYPADHVQPVSNLTNVDIGNPGLAGSASYSNNTWTVKGAGNSLSNGMSFVFKKMSGDAGLVVKVTAMSLNTASSGLMIRQSLASGSSYWNIQLAATGGVGPHGQPKAPWWLKIERVGNRIFTYHSPDGVNWTSINCFYSSSPYPSDLYYGFYTISNNTSALNTTTFTNVGFSQEAPAGSPEITSNTSATAITGQAFSYQITANGNPTGYSASGLPAGLTLDASTGIISGTPSALGNSEITLGAINSTGTGHATLILSVVNSQAPATPASLVASVVNSSQIKLSWTASANTNSYTVKRSTTSGGPYTVVQAGVIGTTFTDAAPVPEVNNYYVVTALAGSMESGVSNEVFASVPPAIPDKPLVTNNKGSVGLVWNAANGAATYNIKRGTVSGGPYTLIANVAATSYTDTLVTNGSPYYYVISSLGAKTESANSAEAFAVPGSSSLTWSADATTNVFSEAINWVENRAPQNPAIFTFKASVDTAVVNDVTGLEVSRIQFDPDAPMYTISGNGMALNNDLVNNSVKLQTISTPLTVNKQLNINAVTANVALSGTITGTGNLLKTGVSVLSLSGSNTYSGGTIVTGSIPAWPPICGIALSGTSTGTPSHPVSGPLGTGKITFNGGALWSEKNDVTIYNDLEVPAGQNGWLFQTTNAVNIYGKLTGSGTLFQDGNTTAGLHLYGDNSGFTGRFVSKLRSGNSRTRFEAAQAGSANADWLLDANSTDCQSLQFSSGTIHFGSLSGRGYIRNNGGGAPVISIGAKNNDGTYSGTITNSGSGNVQVEKVGTGTLIFSGNCTYGGTTTVKGGKFFLSNNGATGTFQSPIVDSSGTFGGTGLSQAAFTIGTGTTASPVLEPGSNGIGTLGTTAALTLNNNATYRAEISTKNGTSDLIRAGSVKLVGNPTLSIADIDAGTLTTGTNLTIIDNSGSNPVAGTFKDLPELALISAGNYKFRITYKGGTGNDVVLLDSRTVPFTITSNQTDTVVIGKPYTYAITTTGAPASFKASGLPSGLSIDTLSGVISGIATQIGSYSATLIVRDSSLVTDTATLSLTVLSKTVNGVLAASGDGKNILEWNPIKGLNYNIKRSATSGGPYINVGQSAVNKFTDSNVSNGTTYYYVIASVDNGTENTPSAEVTARPAAGQWGNWKFDEAGGTKAIDSWGANHGLLASTATRAAGKSGQALYLDGSANAYATLPAGVVNLSDFTISMWVKMDAITTWMRAFDFGTGTTKYMFLCIQAAVSGGKSTVRYAIKNGGAEQQVSYNYTFPLNTWTNFTLTRSGNTVTMYINGTSVASNTAVTIKPSDLGLTDLNYLGKSQFIADPMFKGAIDEFKIYSRALTPAEIGNNLLNSQTIAFAPIPAKQIGDADFDPGASASSGLPVSYTSADTTVATIVSGKVHIVKAGNTQIKASQSGNATYQAAPDATQTLIINKKPQTIMFAQIPSRYAGDADFNLSAISSAGLPVTFSSSDPNVATVTNGLVHITGIGTTTFTASSAGNDTYRDTTIAQVFRVLPINLAVQHMDGDNGQLSNNVIRPYLKIMNQDSISIPYQQLTVRYWLTPENYAGITTWIDYAQLGNSKVIMHYTPLSQPRDQALGYIEYSFDPSAGNLAPLSNSGVIQSRLANMDWSNLSENNDFSYASGSSYTNNQHITLYRNGVLIWGTEPAAVPATQNLRIIEESKTSTGNAISTYLSMENQGNVPVDYKDITLRYFFTDEGSKPLNYWIDYAKIGTSKVNGQFIQISPAKVNADTYFELKFDASAGILYPLSTTGNIQFRIAKSDWSNFDQTNDYSYKSGAASENNRVCIYYQGRLIYGIEPSAFSTQSMMATNRSNSVTDANSSADDAVIVHQGISPNGDGINDFLQIEGINAYPQNTLTIVNASGYRVYQVKNYDNIRQVFNGRSNNGQQLAAGTYFYQLDYQRDNQTVRKAGYLIIKY